METAKSQISGQFIVSKNPISNFKLLKTIERFHFRNNFFGTATLCAVLHYIVDSIAETLNSGMCTDNPLLPIDDFDSNKEPRCCKIANSVPIKIAKCRIS